MKDILIAKGIFSKLVISLNDEVDNRLMYLDAANNPLAQVKDELTATLKKFEQVYFETVNNAEADGNGLPAEDSTPPQSDLEAQG